MKKRLCSFHSLVLGMVAVLLVAVAKVVSARDALDIMGTFTKMSTVQSPPPEMPSNIGTSLEDVVGTVMVLLIAVA